MEKKLTEFVGLICKQLFSHEVRIELNRPEEKFGDYTSNVALRLAGKLGKSPQEVAEAIVAQLNKKGVFAQVAGPGFINIRLSDQDIFEAARKATALGQSLKNQTIVTEYSDPNPFKVLHAGHLYTTLVGDVVANTLEAAGANVKRVNYGGDVGLHAAKSMYAIIQELGGEKPAKLQEFDDENKLEWLSERYVSGAAKYETDDKARLAIVAINKRIYQIHSENDQDSAFAKIYWTTRQWSYDGFEDFYKNLQVNKFDKYYPESTVAELGLKTIHDNLGKVYEKSDGAIVFKGEKYGLHTRVFINSEGLPTYEAKEVGISLKKYQDYKYDKSIIITGSEIQQYMQVVLKSISLFEPKLAERTTHLSHGMIKMAGGTKMSSRKGNILRAQDILDSAEVANKNQNETPNYDVTLGAVKYAMLKNSIGGDIIFNPQESVSQEGNSGPYLQYALVRARSILAKLEANSKVETNSKVEKLETYERSLARQLSLYPEVFQAALGDSSPHHICTYLYELAQIFNRFYENSRVSGDPREQLRINLVQSYEKVLSHGLKLLGMPAPEKM